MVFPTQAKKTEKKMLTNLFNAVASASKENNLVNVY